MTWLRNAKWANALWLAVYVTTTVAANVLHHHTHHGHAHHSACQHGSHDHDHATHEHCEHHDHEHKHADEHGDQLVANESHDDCAICRHLGLSFLPWVGTTPALSHEVIATVNSREVWHEPASLCLTLHARAPPESV